MNAKFLTALTLEKRSNTTLPQSKRMNRIRDETCKFISILKHHTFIDKQEKRLDS